jgi:hypothetical protein
MDKELYSASKTMLKKGESHWRLFPLVAAIYDLNKFV